MARGNLASIRKERCSGAGPAARMWIATLGGPAQQQEATITRLEKEVEILEIEYF
jgi:hypothetical protein